MATLVDGLIHAYATNNRVNVYLVENLAEEAWRAEPSKGRNIASMVAHIHNVRLMWLKSIGAEVPESFDPETVTRKEAIGALEGSWRALEVELRRALEGDGKIKGFKPDAASFFGYLVAHDAHHRGQISLVARQVGHPVSKSVNFGMWEWGTR